MQDDFFVYGVNFEFRQDMIVQKFHAIENGELIPDDFVFGGEVVSAGFERVCAGGRIYNDGVFSMLRPFPHLHEGFVKRCLIRRFVSLGREGHAAAVTLGIGGNLQVDVCPLGDGEEGFAE